LKLKTGYEVSYSEYVDMNDKNLRLIGILALFLSIIVTVPVMLRASVWKIDSEGFLFILWTVSPYISLFSADVILRMTTSISKLSLLFCVTSLLMLGFTLLAYVGTLGDKSSTYALIFVFVPFYLYIGGVIVFGIGLILALLARLSKS